MKKDYSFHRKRPVIYAAVALTLMLLVMLPGCDDPGVATKHLSGFEEELPSELRGLKVYTVSLGDGEYIKVGILDGKVTSSNYQTGETQSTTIIINNSGNERIIKGTILSETDDIIVIKK